MTLRQRILKLIYPLFILYGRFTSRPVILENTSAVRPPGSFYMLHIVLNDGSQLPLLHLRGKKILLVNTASDCGYTAQYGELQELQDAFKEYLVVIAFPSNDFKNQEKGSDKEIEAFCKRGFGVRFPVSVKTHVRKSGVQHPVYRWLTSSDLNGWNNRQPSWNFSKYLVSEDGVLTHYFDPQVSPLNSRVLDALKPKL